MPRVERWPIWKIAAACVACTLVAVGLFVAMVTVERATPPSTAPDERAPALTPASLLLMLGVMAAALTVLSAAWLGYRIWDDYTPEWKKRARKRR